MQFKFLNSGFTLHLAMYKLLGLTQEPYILKKNISEYLPHLLCTSFSQEHKNAPDEAFLSTITSPQGQGHTLTQYISRQWLLK